MKAGSSAEVAGPPEVAAYSELNGGYEALVHRSFYEHVLRDVETALLNEILRNRSAGDSLLDVGCGDGHFACLAAKAELDVTAVDPAVGMREATAARAARDGLIVKVQKGDVTQLRFADASFDVVLCLGSVIHLSKNPFKALSELARVVRPGGVLLIDAENPTAFPFKGRTEKRTSREVKLFDWPLVVNDRTVKLCLAVPPLDAVARLVRSDGFSVAKRRGVHILSWLSPYTRQSASLVNNGRTPSLVTLAAFLDRYIGQFGWSMRFASHVVYVFQKGT